MIPRDDELRLAALARARILEGIGSIQDSQGYSIQFHDPSPNWLTGSRLKSIVAQLEGGLVRLGALRVFLHAPCGASQHHELAQNVYGHSGYWRYALEDGRTDVELAANGAIVIDGTPMETDFDAALARQTVSMRPCPCRPAKLATEHSVCAYFLWPRDPDSRLGALSEITLTLGEAVDRSGERKRRSGIREVLQQALIKLDRLIVEETADAVLAGVAYRLGLGNQRIGGSGCWRAANSQRDRVRRPEKIDRSYLCPSSG